jgi:hypothetical protein
MPDRGNSPLVVHTRMPRPVRRGARIRPIMLSTRDTDRGRLDKRRDSRRCPKISDGTPPTFGLQFHPPSSRARSRMSPKHIVIEVAEHWRGLADALRLVAEQWSDLGGKGDDVSHRRRI